MFTGKDFENMGNAAASEYVTSNKPLNTTITKIAEHYGLNNEQIARVVEQANVETYLKLNKVADDKYTTFDPADTVKVASALKFTVEKKAHLASDYDDIIETSNDFELETNSITDEQRAVNEASDEKMTKQAYKSIVEKVDAKLSELDENFSRESVVLYNIVKQASLESGQFGIVKQAMLTAVPSPVTELIVDVYKVKLVKEAAFLNYDEVETPKGVLNEDHPLVSSLTKLSVLKDEYTAMNDLKAELAKMATAPALKAIKDLLSAGKHTGQAGIDLSVGLAKKIKGAPAIGAAIATGAAGLYLGKARGRNEASKSNMRINQDNVTRAKNNRPI